MSINILSVWSLNRANTVQVSRNSPYEITQIINCSVLIYENNIYMYYLNPELKKTSCIKLHHQKNEINNKSIGHNINIDVCRLLNQNCSSKYIETQSFTQVLASIANTYISYTIALTERKLDKSNCSMFIAHAHLLCINCWSNQQDFFIIIWELITTYKL